MSDKYLSLEYLASCSNSSLEAFELSRLNEAANLNKQLFELFESCVRAQAEAWVARCLRERRRNDSVDSVSSLSKAAPPMPALQLTSSFADDICGQLPEAHVLRQVRVQPCSRREVQAATTSNLSFFPDAAAPVTRVPALQPSSSGGHGAATDKRANTNAAKQLLRLIAGGPSERLAEARW